MEITFNTENNGLTISDTLLLVGPLSGKLDGGLDGLGTGIHGQYHIILEEGGDLFCKLPEDGIIESPRREG